MTVRALLVGAAALTTVPAPIPAWAQAPGAPDAGRGAEANIFGEWTLEAAPVFPDCTFTGTAVIEPGSSPDVHQCSLVIHDVCPAWNRVARETCVARRAGDTLTIRSRVDSVDPPEDETFSYYPDHFSLTIVDDSNMSGALFTEPYTANARFRRENGPIS